MVNEDIITALKNAVEHGESLESAIAVAINSGYNPREVQEAARFIGQGAINMENMSKDEILTMPNKKGFFSKVFGSKKPESQPLPAPKPLQPLKPAPMKPPQQSLKSLYQAQPPQPPLQSRQSFQQPASIPRPAQQYYQAQAIPIRRLSSQEPQQSKQQIKLDIETDYPAKPLTIQLSTPQKKSYIKEIILFVLLLILVVILVITIRYRNEVIRFFS